MRIRITPRRARWIGWLGAHALRALGATWRFRLGGFEVRPDEVRYLMAFLHGDMLMPAVFFRRQRTAIMISEYGDGELIAQVVKRMGRFVPVRGSSTRGGARAFRQMMQGYADMHWALTPDGPRGPRGTVQEGVIQLAAEGGRPVLPAGYAAAPAKRFRSWDRFVLPAPFARIACHFEEPLVVPAGVDRAERGKLALALEERLASAHEQAVRALSTW